MINELFGEYVNFFIFVYGASFFVIPVCIAIKRREIAHFNLTDSFVLLAIFGFLHGIGDLLPLVPRVISLNQSQTTYVSMVRILLDMMSFQFLAFFAFLELTKAKYRLQFIFASSPIALIVIYLVGANIMNNAKLAYNAATYLIGVPTALLAAASFVHLAIRFRDVGTPSLRRDFFAFAGVFFAYAAFKLVPVYSAFGVIAPTGVPVLIARTMAAVFIALLTVRVLNAFEA